MRLGIKGKGVMLAVAGDEHHPIPLLYGSQRKCTPVGTRLSFSQKDGKGKD